MARSTKKPSSRRGGASRRRSPPPAPARAVGPAAKAGRPQSLAHAVLAHLASLKTVFDAVPFGVWIRDRDGRLIFQNDETVRLWGAQLGTRPEDSGVHASVAAAWQADNRRALAGRLIKRDVEYQVRGVSRPFRNIVGPLRIGRRIAGVMGFVIDLSERKAAETALRESDAWFRAIFHGAMDGIILADAETRRFSMPNPRICEMLGYTADELCRMAVPEIHPVNDRPRVSAWFRNLVDGDVAVAPEIPVRRKDGSVFYADITGRPIEVAGQRFMLGVFHDVSRRRESDRARAETERRLHFALLDSSITVFGHDTELRYLWVHNPTLRHSLGTVIGKTDADFMPPQFAEPLMAAKREGLKLGKASRREVVVPDVPSGTRCYDLRMEPTFDPAGGVTGLTCVAIDITDRRRTEEALRESEARYRSVFDGAGDGIVVIDPETAGFIEFNDEACRRLGYTRDEFARLTIGDIDVVESTPMAARHVRQVAEAGSERFDVRHRCKSGEILEVEVHARPIEWGGRRVVMGIWRDVTDRRNAEDAYRKAHEELQATLNALPDFVFELDRDGRILAWHANQPDLLYVEPERFLGRTVGEVLPPGATEVIRNAMQEAARTGLHRGSVYSLDMPGGRGWYELSVAIRGELSDPSSRFVVLVRDITARRKAEEALRESEERYRMMVEAIPTMAWRCDASGGVVESNKRWYDYTGQTQESASGSGWMSAVHPDDLARVAKTVADDVAGGVVYETEYRLKRASDGQYRWHLARALPVRDEAGRITGWFGSATDIDEQKRTEELLEQRISERTQALRESESRLKRVFDGSNDGYWEWYVDRDEVHLSPAMRTILGMPPGDGLVGRESIRRMMHPDDVARVTLVVSAVMRTGAATDHYEMEHRQIHGDGRVVWVHTRATVTQRGSDGRATTVSGVTTDITERKQAEETQRQLERQVLEAAEREQQRIGNDLHDGLAQHLAALAYSADDLRLRLSARDPLEAQRADELARHLRDAINQTRRLAAALHPIEASTPNGLRDGLEDLCQMVHDFMHVRCHLHADKAATVPDPAQATHLFRIAQESVHNAVRHGGAADIWMELAREEDAICLKIRDNGKGFDTVNHQKKAGIGLSTMRYRAAAVGGVLEVESTPGQGTTVTCRVPASRSLQPAKAGKPKRAARPRRRT